MLKYDKFAISILGGCAKGFPAIGFIRFLQEEGITPRVAAGSSSGGIVCAMYVIGMKWYDMLQEVTKFKITTLISLPDILHLKSFIGKTKLDNLFLSYSPENPKIEDLPIKAIMYASDTLDGSRVFIDKGPLLDGMTTSMAFPIFFPSPIRLNGKVLVDGDLSHSYSVKVLKERYNVSKVIGVRHFITNRLNDFGPNANIFYEIINMWRMMQYQAGKEMLDKPDFEVKFNADGMSYLDFAKVPEYTNRVYNYCVDHKKDIFHTLNLAEKS